MLLKYFYDKALAHASYMVGCQKIGEAIVVDPSRSVEQYLDAAKAEGLRIVGAAESHIHADFVSGSRELADRVGAKLYLEGRKRGQVGTGPFMEYGGIWTCPLCSPSLFVAPCLYCSVKEWQFRRRAKFVGEPTSVNAGSTNSPET